MASGNGVIERLTRWRWQVPLLVVASLLVLEVVEHWGIQQLPNPAHETVENGLIFIELLVYMIFFPVLLWRGLTYLRENTRAAEKARQDLIDSYKSVERANRRLSLLAEVNRRLAAAQDEETLLAEITHLSLEISGAAGCSLVLLDERGKPGRASIQGDVSEKVANDWEAHIAKNPGQGGICPTCGDRTGTDPEECPLMRFQPPGSPVLKVLCLPLTRGGVHFGTASLFFDDQQHPNPDERWLLESLGGEMAIALESHRLRARELETLYRLERSRRRESLHETLAGMLASLNEAFGASGGVITLFSPEGGGAEAIARVGQAPDSTMRLIHELVRGAMEAGNPLVINDPEQVGEERTSLRSLLIAPIQTENGDLGALVLRADSPSVFNRRRVRTLALVAHQMALLVENHRLYAKAEQQATRAERARLAREIHDGLAQTLGYLKLRASQLASWLDDDQVARARSELQAMRSLLADAYLDTREAIDGLRIRPVIEADAAWLNRVADDFHALSSIPVELHVAPSPPVPIEIQLQLQRIVQEALSNVRKHARANNVRIDWDYKEGRIHVRIKDNGRGFNLGDVPPAARHGLKIMRERAALFGAAIEIDSRWEQGTVVDVTLPVGEMQVPDA